MGTSIGDTFTSRFLLFFQLTHPSDVQLVSRFLLDGFYFGNFFWND